MWSVSERLPRLVNEWIPTAQTDPSVQEASLICPMREADNQLRPFCGYPDDVRSIHCLELVVVQRIIQ